MLVRRFRSLQGKRRFSPPLNLTNDQLPASKQTRPFPSCAYHETNSSLPAPSELNPTGLVNLNELEKEVTHLPSARQKREENFESLSRQLPQCLPSGNKGTAMKSQMVQYQTLFLFPADPNREQLGWEDEGNEPIPPGMIV